MTILSFFLISYSQLPKASAQAQMNYANYNFNNVSGTGINGSVTAYVGILTDGGVSLWGLKFNITTNSSITTVVINGAKNGTVYQRGLTFPSTSTANNDIELIGVQISPLEKMFMGMYSESLLVIPSIHGIPNEYSFNLSVYVVANSTSNQTIYLSSGDSPLITIIFQNPDTSPSISTLFFSLMYLLPIGLPIAIIVINIISNRSRKKERKADNVKKSGGSINEE